MPGGIVHRFKTIEIDINQRVALMVVADALQQPLEMAFKAYAVGKMGEGVVRGAVAQLAQHFARFGNVMDNQHRADIFPFQRAERRNGVMNIVIAAAAAVQHHILFNTGAGLRGFAVVNIVKQRAVIAKRDTQNREDWLADSLFLTPAAHLLGDRVHKGDVHIDIGTNHRFADRIERDMQPLFLLEQRLVKLFHLGHVHVHAEQPLHLALFIQHAVGQRANVAHAVFHLNAIFHLKRHARAQRLLDGGFRLGDIFFQQPRFPELVGRARVRRHFIKLKHALIPGEHVGAKFPLPDADAACFVGERNTLHQTFVHPLGALEIGNILHLGDEVER